MNIKVFKTNANGKIEFTRCELEKMLNDIYTEGYTAGEKHAKESYWTWTAPYISSIDLGSSTLTTTPAITYDTKITCDNTAPKITSTTVATTTPVAETKNDQSKTYTVDLGKVNFGDLSKTIDEILNGKMSSDPFTTLAKELGNL